MALGVHGREGALVILNHLWTISYGIGAKPAIPKDLSTGWDAFPTIRDRPGYPVARDDLILCYIVRCIAQDGFLSR